MFSNPETVKIIALLILGMAKLIAGLTPMHLVEVLKGGYGERQVKCITSLSMCFGGGVLLSSCMLHMIPKVRDGLIMMDWKSSFPMGEFFVCCGFFAVFLIEEFVLSMTRDTNKRSIEAEMRINGKVTPFSSTSGNLMMEDMEISKKTHHLLVLLALSLHSGLEGLALGLQTSTLQAVWLLFTAILIHAVLILFSMGLQLVSDGYTELQIVLYMVTSAVSTPLGGGIGLIAVGKMEKVYGGTVLILQGLAAGAILFVTFFEVLEKEKKKGGFLRFLFVFLGFLAMAGLQTLGE